MKAVGDFLYKNMYVISPSVVLLILIYCGIMFLAPSMSVRKIMYKIFAYTIGAVLIILCVILFLWIIVQKWF